MFESHIRRDIHDNWHDEARLVPTPDEPMLLLLDVSPLLAVNVVHYKVVMRSGSWLGHS